MEWIGHIKAQLEEEIRRFREEADKVVEEGIKLREEAERISEEIKNIVEGVFGKLEESMIEEWEEEENKEEKKEFIGNYREALVTLIIYPKNIKEAVFKGKENK